MTKIPDVPTDIWSNLYDAALRFKKRAPWEFMDDSQVFGLRDEETGETGYACVLGAAGQMFGLCLYRGARGLDAHRRMQALELTPDSDDIFTAQDCLMASFEDREALDKADRAVVKALGLKLRGAGVWPLFRSHRPGYFPWLLDANEALFLTEALLCADHVAREVEERGLDLNSRPGQALIHVLTDGGRFESSWESRPAYEPAPLPPLALDEDRIARVRAKASGRAGAWEADAFFLPTPVGDGERPYFPKTAFIVDQSTGMVLPPKMAGPEAPPHQLIADALLDAAEAVGALPDAVFVENVALAGGLTPFGQAVGVEIKVKKRLTALGRARKDLTKKMSALA